LRRWEKQINVSDSRKKKLRQISAYILDKFTKVVHKGAIIHNTTRWALQEQRPENLSGFKASHEWIRRFKLAHQIVSRKITKFITKNL